MRIHIKALCALAAFSTVTWYSLESFKQTKDHKPKNAYHLQKEVKRYDQPDKAAAWLQSMRGTPKGTNPATLNLKIKQQLDVQAKASKTTPTIPPLAFEDIGPGVFGGRIRAFAIHPSDPNTLLTAGISGGVWKSTDDGQSWQPKSDFLSNIVIGSMTTDPDHPNRVFIGTGEGFFNFDAAQGAGIYVSEDFGDTWQALPNTVNDNFYYVNRLARIPQSDVLLAATQRGIFRSTDLGDTWTEISNVSTTGRGFVDLKVNPNNEQHVLAVHYGFVNDSLALEITSPGQISGQYDAIPAGFGPDFGINGISGDIVLVDDNSGTIEDGCQPITNDVTGNIALIQRGSCNFTVKVKNAQDAGAVAAIIYQNGPDAPFTMGGEDDTITIPSAMISQSAGQLIVDANNTVSGSVKPAIAEPLQRFVMESDNGGSSWAVLDNGLPKLNVGRMELAFGSDGVAYVAVSNADNATLGLWRSPGQGQAFSKTASDTAFIERQGWYDLAIAVNPSDSDHVLMGAVDQFVSFNGGDTIAANSFWSPNAGFMSNYIHADHHGYIFSPHNPNHVYVVSDGGVSKSEDGGQSYFNLNNGLNISQTYGIAVSPDGSRVTSGTQDNGSQMYYGNSQDWFEWQGGDGGYSAWDQQQPQFVYGSYVEGQLYGSNNQGLAVQAMELPDTDGARFIQPFILDPLNGNRLMVGTDNVFFTNNARSLGAATWTDVTGTLDGTSITALAFNPNNPSQAFAATAFGNIFRIDGLGTSNTVTQIYSNNSSFSDIVTDLVVSPGNRLFATKGNYQSNRLQSTPADQSSWQNESANLPDMPLYSLVFDPSDPNQMYLGSELGLWASTATGWQRYGYDVAYTRVIDLVWQGTDHLYVGTHGRGTFKASRSPFTVRYDRFITTQSSCDDDNRLDGGESGILMFTIENQIGINLEGVSVSWNTPAGTSIPTSSQAIGTLPAHTDITIPIQVTLDGSNSCLSDLKFDLMLSHNGGSYGHNFTVFTGANQGFDTKGFVANAESDPVMTAEVALGQSNWQPVSSDAFEGNRSWFASNEGEYGDKTLTSPWLIAGSGDSELDFALRYDMEGTSFQYWDGVVLELRTTDGTWQDIGHLSSVAYDGQLYLNNPIQGRQAWSGTQLAWRQASVDLGNQWAGQSFQFRFRVVSDSNSAATGFWVDDIRIENAYLPDAAGCDVCNSTAGDQARPNKGMWFDPSRNGHGFVIESIDFKDIYYTMFYTYNDLGVNEWYNSVTTWSNGMLNEHFEPGTLDRPTWDWQANTFTFDNNISDGRLMFNFNNDDAVSHSACQDGHPNRDLSQSALVTWRIDGTEATWCVQPIVAEASKPNPDFGGTWWGGLSESGWGFSIAQAFDSVTSIIYFYDASGLPRWAIGSAANHQPGQPLTIPLTQVIGYGRTQTPVPFSTVLSGELTLQLHNTIRDERIDGIGTLELEFLNNPGGTWNRENLPIGIYTAPHR